MAFSIVEFTTEKTVEIVPSMWIRGDKCWWPSVKGPKLQRLLVNKDSQPDLENGMAFDVKVVKSFESYSEAREKLPEAEETSCLDTVSESEKIKSRKERKRKRQSFYGRTEMSPFSPSSSGDDDSMESVSLFAVPTVNSLELSVGTSNRQPPQVVTPASQDKPSEQNMNNIQHHSITEVFAAMQNEFHRFQEVVMRQLIKIEKKIDDNTEELKYLKNMLPKRAGATAAEEGNLPKFPLDTIEDLKSVEGWLSSSNNVQILTNHLSIIGGACAKDTTRRILLRTFSKNLAMNLNWTGKNLKYPMMNTIIVKVIIASVRLAHQGDVIPENVIEDLIRGFFRFAKDREGGRGKRRTE